MLKHSSIVRRLKGLRFNLSGKHYNTTTNMADIQLGNVGLPLKSVVEALNKFADLSLAASWDNVGLLIEPIDTKLISHALLTNDLTESVMQEAINVNANLIISYHPPIFKPLTSVTSKTWKERIVARCLQHNIAVYSPHTCFDSVKGGVNDWLASAFHKEIKCSEPIEQREKGENGMGRLCTLKHKIFIDDAVQLIKQHIGLKYVRLARGYNTDGFINSVAVCAGAGISVLKDIPADLYVTGEMSHHEVLDIIHCGINVILTNHSDSERGFLLEFASTLNNILKNSVKITVSQTDTDPLKTL